MQFVSIIDQKKPTHSEGFKNPSDFLQFLCLTLEEEFSKIVSANRVMYFHTLSNSPEGIMQIW